MVTCDWLEEEIAVIPDCNVEAIDLNGTQDHFHIRVISESFEGMRPLQRQKIILNHFKPYIPRPIHAIDIKCMTPAQAEKQEIQYSTHTLEEQESTLRGFKNTKIRREINELDT